MSAFYVSADDPPSKRAILTTALGIFSRDGISGTSVRAIAEAAGYTNPALFKFFKTKDELAVYLFERCYRKNVEVLESAIASQRDFRTKLRAALEALTTFVAEEPDAFFFVQDNLRVLWLQSSPELRKKSMFVEFRRLLEAGRREGLVNARMPLELQLAALIGFLSQLARMNHFRELGKPITKRVDEIETMLLVMLRA